MPALLCSLALAALPLQSVATEGRPAPVFVENLGQWPDSVLFFGRLGGVDVRVERAAIWFQALEALEPVQRPDPRQGPRPDLRGTTEGSTTRARLHAVRMTFPGAAEPLVLGERVSEGRWNYLRGPREDWVTGAHGYGTVRLDELWPGVDLVLLVDEAGRPRFDFELEAGVDPIAVRIQLEGDGVPTLCCGRVELDSGSASWAFTAPRSAQPMLEGPVPVESRWRLEPNGTLGFELEGASAVRPLVIDPSVVFSSYLGGLGHDYIIGVYPVGGGAVLLTGRSSTENFPVLPGGYDLDFNANGEDIFATRVADNGSTPVYSTYLTGPGAGSFVNYVHTDAQDECVFVAHTTVDTETVTLGAYVSPGAKEVAAQVSVAKLNESGTDLEYSARLGTDELIAARGLSVTEDGSVLVFGVDLGESLPVEHEIVGAGPALAEDSLGWIVELSPDGSTLTRSVGFRGEGYHTVGTVMPLPTGELLFGLGTESLGFPVTPDAIQTTPNPANFERAVLGRLNEDWSALEYATYLSTSKADRVAGFTLVAKTAYWAHVQVGGGEVSWPDELQVPPPPAQSFIRAMLLFDSDSHELMGVRWVPGITDGPRTLVDVDGGIVTSLPTSDLSLLFEPGEPFGTFGDAAVSKRDLFSEHGLWEYRFGGSSTNPFLKSTSIYDLEWDEAHQLVLGGNTNVTNMLTTPGVIDTVHGPYQQDEGWFMKLDLSHAGVERFGEPTSACTGETRIGARVLPVAGEPLFGLSCVGAPRNAPGVLLRSPGPAIVPLEVSGAQLWLDPASLHATAVLADSLGWAAVDVPLTGVPVGVGAYFQFAWVDPGSCGSIGALHASDAIGITTQP